MAPEHDARNRAFYDHESDEPSSRRRRAAADWGVNEDIFDRMPSRRFARSDRRAEHHEEPRFERRVSGPSRPVGAWTDEVPRGEDAWGEEPLPSRGERPDRDDPLPSRGARPGRDEPPPSRADPPAPRGAPPEREEPLPSRGDRPDRDEPRGRTDDFPAGGTGHFPAAPGRRTRRPAESWTVTDDHVPVEDGKRSIDSWLAPEANQEFALVPGESRTVVLETTGPEPLIEAPPERRTVTITGHPDRMPVPRVSRPPRTALERIGASPDRIVGYAVLLGFVLVLIAVLTTGQ